jgi:hypothetical protein
VWRTLGAFAALAVGVSCGGDPPRPPPIARPIDEPHAVMIILPVFQELNVDVERNRIIHVGDDQRQLRLDVAAKGKGWGIAYITNTDGEKLGPDLPVRKDPDQLVVMDASGDGEAGQRAILFYAGDYMTDDVYGDQHTKTSIAAEQKLQLTTRDVIRTAQHEGWP